MTEQLAKCCKSGNLDKARQILKNDINHEIDIHEYDDYLFRLSCKYGHRHIAEWIMDLEMEMDDIDICSCYIKQDLFTITRRHVVNIRASNDSAFVICCVHNQLDMLKWLFQLIEDDPKIKPLKIDIINQLFCKCCQHNNINIAEYLLLEFPNIDIHTNSEFAFRAICGTGNLHFIDYLFTFEKTQGLIDIHILEDDAFCYACKSGNIEMIEYLLGYETLRGKINIHSRNGSAFLIACKNGHLDIIKYIISLGINHDFVATQVMNYGFCLCCEHGHLKCVKWFLSEFKELDIHINNDIAFRLCCQNGHLDIAKFLILNDILHEIDIHACHEFAFQMCCRYGNNLIAEWLLTLEENYGKITNYDYTFYLSCKHDQLEIAKWILSLELCKEEIIDIHKFNDVIFYDSCFHETFMIAEFLLSLESEKGEINLKIKDKVFIDSCKYKQLKVAEWIQSKYPDRYELKIKNGDIKIQRIIK
jgi:ankyrin repeat protein